MDRQSTTANSSAAPLVDVTLPPALVRLFPDAPSRLDPRAATRPRGASMRWMSAGPACATACIDSTPRIRRHINVFVEGRRAGLETPLEPGAKVFIITAVSGG